MIRKAVISIPTPCHENWEKMSDIDKGKFCGSCQKNVHDFTKASDREILEKINREKNICGRFLNSQLEREITIPKEKSSIWMAAASTVVSIVGLGNNEIQAQTQTKGEVVQTEVFDHVPGKTTIPSATKTISGVVSDSSGALPGANIVIKGTAIGTSTDIDGKFSINVKDGDTIVASFVGLKDEEIVVGKALNYPVTLRDSNIMLGAVVVSGRMGIVNTKTQTTNEEKRRKINEKIEVEKKRLVPKK